MPTILCLETSGKNCSVALFEDMTQISLIEEQTEHFSHSENLHIFIERILEQTAISRIDAVAISAGPGSYTGLRIGTATAKGLCYAWNIPLIAISTLRILAEKAMACSADFSYCIPMIDARRMEVFTTVYDATMQSIEEERAEILTEASFYNYLEKGKIVFLGDGSDKFQEICNHPNAHFITKQFPSAKDMGALAFIKYKEKNFENLAYFEPFYLKEFYFAK